MIEIEKNIQMQPAKNNSKYPFNEMEIGDSVRYVGKHESGAYNVSKAASTRLGPKQFKGGRDASGAWRIWRIA